MPLISVIVPCYNQAQYLDECLQSVLDQTYQNWECIIVNDGSPDHTEEVAKKWVEKDARFKYLYRENGGLSSARNAGIEMAEGEWIQFLDSDDKIHKEKFTISSQYFKEFDIIFTEYSLLFYDKISKNFKNQFINYEIDFDSIVLNWDLNYTIPIHCALIKNEQLPKFNINLKAKEDLVFWIQYFLKRRKYYIVNKQYAVYRINETSMTRNINHMQENELKAYDYIFKKLIKEEQLKYDFLIHKIIHQQNIIKELEKKHSRNQKEYLNLKNSKRYKIGNRIASLYENLFRK